MPTRATKRGAAAHAARARLRRADLRRELRRADARARARGQRRARAGGRPLRDRRAPDLGLRGADRVARAARPATRSIRRRFGELVVHTPHATVRWPLPLTFSTFDYRTLCGLLREGSPVDDVRDRDGRAASHRARAQRAHRPRRAARAADRRRARLAARALGGGDDPAARRAPVARARGAPARVAATISRSGSTALRAAPATAGASRPTASCGSASARSSRASTSASRPSRSPRDLGRRRGPLPGQLDPARAARRRPRTASSSSATRPGTACR